MAGTINTSKKNLIQEILKSMEYGPLIESSTSAKVWLKDRKLGPFIDGAFKGTSSQLEILKPCTQDVLGTVGQSVVDNINSAVSSALKAADAWTKLSGHERACHLYSLARHLQKNATLLAQMDSLNRGVQYRDPKEFDVPAMVRFFYHYAGWAELLSSSSELQNWRPVGVVVGIVSESSPLMTLAQVMAPALAAGNTICLKPPECAPLSSLLFANIANQAGLPPGVINVLPGDSSIEQQLATHAQVSNVIFSGLMSVGRHLREQTAGLGIHLTMLLNAGKSSMLVFDSADLDSAVDRVVDAAWFNQGQAPWCLGRLFVQESVWHDFISKLRIRMGHIRVGNSFEKLADVGSPLNRDIISDMMAATLLAEKNGLEVFQANVPSGLPSETFIRPTLAIGGFTESNRVIDDDRLLQPLSVVPFRTAKEAIALSNNSRSGLAASVWTENVSLALEVAHQLQVGTVWVNSHGIIDAGVPFSGWKQSGIGILGGKGGLLEFLQYQGVRTNMTTEHVEYKSFGATPDISAVSCPPSVCQQNDNGVVDCTYKLYYGGAYKRPDGNSSLVVFDGTGKVYGSIAEGNRKDVRNAVEAALKAQPVWWKLGAHLRSQILYNTAEKLQSRREDFISHLTVLYGKADREFATKELDACQRVLFHWAASCDKKHVSTGEISPNNNFATIINREPMGVIGAVQTPIQSPPGPLALLNFVSMFAPAVCYGNSIVVIADSVHPTPAVEFCEVLDCSDFPAGVVNVLTGDTKYLAAQLASHQEVAALWAPGIEATTAKYIEWASSANMKDTWVDRLPCFDNLEQVTDCSELFELHSIRYKSIWIPCEEIYAN